MKKQPFWTVEQLALGSIVMIVLILLGTAGMAYWGGRSMVEASQHMGQTYRDTRTFYTFYDAVHEAEDVQMDYVLRGEERLLLRYYDKAREVREKRALINDFLKNRTGDKRFGELTEKLDKLVMNLDEIVELRKREGVEAAEKRQRAVDPDEVLERLEPDLDAVVLELHGVANQAGQESGEHFRNWILGGLAILILFVIASTLLTLRYIDRNMGGVLAQVQSSTVELHAAAAQQVSGAKEQVTAASEVSTTIKELLSTSRQIAESAQKVTKIAVETSTSAKVGDQTVQKAQEAIDTVRHQVDVIVNHMLDLGRKSQEIGGILDIINELSEQTNILAINATIESAGAGEAGRRFAVVADEIRKLADRVSGSTKEIRSLIEEIRAAANTTVMATEDGSKAVDAGTKQFTEVAVAFKQIVDLVSSTALASREIELSTKQQSTAVEQVNAAISEVARTARETEASLNQTLQTVSDLTTLSVDFANIIRAKSKKA